MSANADLEILRCRDAAKGRDDHDDNTTTNKSGGSIYVVRLQAKHGDAAVRGLRWILKTAWRHYGLKALSVTEEALKPEVMPS
jgi:hypothetical protein